MTVLVLSLFPGIGLLDRAFEETGFCVVRGPDILWGGDIRRFHPPSSKFDGIIGGPPCQAHSHLGRVVAMAAGQEVAEDLIPEFVRCVMEAAPAWFIMENVPDAPIPKVDGYIVDSHLIDNRIDCGGEQRRVRRFSFGTRDGRKLGLGWWRPMTPQKCIPTVTANATVWKDGRAFGDKSDRYFRATMLPAQGLPADFDLPGFTVQGKIRAVGNGVPLAMGRAVARAVMVAMETRDVSAA